MSKPTKITIEIDLGNAAFGKYPEFEIATILEDYAAMLRDVRGLVAKELVDTSDTPCGSVTLEGGE